MFSHKGYTDHNSVKSTTLSDTSGTHREETRPKKG